MADHDAVPAKPIVLISGPPGAGKSTVTQELVAQSEGPVALIEGDLFWSSAVFSVKDAIRRGSCHRKTKGLDPSPKNPTKSCLGYSDRVIAARALPLKLSAVAVILFVANFMPWGTLRVFDGMPVAFTGPAFPSGDGGASIDLTGWNGSASVLGVWTPNWTGFAAAALLAAWSWFDPELANRRWSPPLAAVFVAHGLFLLYATIAAQGARVGLGMVVAIAAWIGAFVTLRRAGKETPQAPTEGARSL